MNLRSWIHSAVEDAFVGVVGVCVAISRIPLQLFPETIILRRTTTSAAAASAAATANDDDCGDGGGCDDENEEEKKKKKKEKSSHCLGPPLRFLTAPIWVAFHSGVTSLRVPWVLSLTAPGATQRRLPV